MERKRELVIRTPDGKVENRYTVEWPTIQNIIDIESTKLMLSKGRYTEMILSGTKWMERVLNYIDMCAYLSILSPELVRDMKVDIRDLDAIDANTGLLKVYKEQFLPWWNEYEKVVNQYEDDRVKDNQTEKGIEDDKGGDK